jgi:hypothetical protein
MIFTTADLFGDRSYSHPEAALILVIASSVIHQKKANKHAFKNML